MSDKRCIECSREINYRDECYFRCRKCGELYLVDNMCAYCAHGEQCDGEPRCEECTNYSTNVNTDAN